MDVYKYLNEILENLHVEGKKIEKKMYSMNEKFNKDFEKNHLILSVESSTRNHLCYLRCALWTTPFGNLHHYYLKAVCFMDPSSRLDS